MGQGFSRAALGALAAGLILGAVGAEAQPGTVRLRGTIEKVDGGTLTVKSREGDTVTVKVPDNVGVAGVVKRTLGLKHSLPDCNEFALGDAAKKGK